MPDQLINILIQLPVVAVFIWYSRDILKQFMTFLQEERTERAKQNQIFAEEIRNLRMAFESHRAEFNTAVQVMQQDKSRRENKGDGK